MKAEETSRRDFIDPNNVYAPTLLDEVDSFPLTIPDPFIPNYNQVGFNCSPDSWTIGTRLRLLCLIAGKLSCHYILCLSPCSLPLNF